MDLFHDTLKEFNKANNINSELTALGHQLCTISRHERILKRQLQKQNSGQVHTIKKKICKHARLKRKISILNRRYKEDINERMKWMLQSLQVYSQTTHLEYFGKHIEFTQPNVEIPSKKSGGTRENSTTTMESTQRNRRDKGKSKQQTVEIPSKISGGTRENSTTTMESTQRNRRDKGKSKQQTDEQGPPNRRMLKSMEENIQTPSSSEYGGAKDEKGEHWKPWNIGPPTHTCQYCNAILWYEERTKRFQRILQPKFTFCCMEGRVQIPLLKEPPALLKFLLGPESGKKGQNYRKYIRVYNGFFAFTSMGGAVDTKINKTKGPYVFRISGQNFHKIGSLLPEEGKKPQFAQLYIYDTENEIANRINTMQKQGNNTEIDEEIVGEISKMLDEENLLAKTFRMARDRYKENPESTFRLRLIGSREKDGRQYNIPTVSEVAGLIVGDFNEGNFRRDVIVEHRQKGLQRISDLHPSFMSMSYPLIHFDAIDGYTVDIPLRDQSGTTSKRQRLTMRQYYCFRFQQRLNEGHTLLQSGRLLQQYIVDSYMAIEEERFRWIRNNQKKLRSDLFSGLMDAAHRGDSDCSNIGKTIILPSSHTGGPRYRVQNYQDAMAICKWAGFPDLFITFTCNPKWPEINDMLKLIGQKDDENRVDIICRVFEMKLFQLMQDLKKEQPFGKIIACIYTIEFQKRGLPHAHILLFLHPAWKNPTSAQIDKIISAEIPSKDDDPDGYRAVEKFMLHGPCGDDNPKSTCMKKDMCTKHFPKKYNEETSMDMDGFPVYKRRKTGIQVEKNKVLLDNRYVVPYNRNLIVKYDAHINVEICNYSRAVKYLFKYIHKGSDRATAAVEAVDKETEIDEIKRYLDCRYISATEACWRIFQYDIHYRHPSVERLPFHLPGEHTVIFEENKCVENVLAIPGLDKTKFTEWFETNKNNEDARDLTYSDFPTHWVWNAKEKRWTRRKNGIAIGRIYFAQPSSGERFYMRMMLNFVKGSTSFECIRTVNGVTYPTFKAACYAMGLLDDDKEWNECLSEAAIWATGNELRNLFVTIIIHCQVSDAAQLWNANKPILSEDITSLQRKRFGMQDLQLNEEQVEAYTLLEIESIMEKMGKSLREVDGMPQPNRSLTRDMGNRLINEELDYDCTELKKKHEESYRSLNQDQKAAYEAIIESVEREEGQTFFINGRGGTGKTFLWNTIIAKLRSESKIVLPVATSGIAALLMPNGRTAHSRFHIPLEVTSESTCEIRQGTLLAKLLLKTSLIIWDEAPMANKYCFEALDKTLRDILKSRFEGSTTKPFGGLTIVCGGDFRQILPVVTKGTRADIVGASINSSYLWEFFRVYELNQNMRLHREDMNSIEAEKIATFDKWLLQIGDGSLYDDIEKEAIKIPEDICDNSQEEPMEAVVKAVYPSLLHNYKDPMYLKERAILTPKNDMVHELNDMIMNMIPVEGRSYYSSDSICKASAKTYDADLMYPVEFLNSLKFNGTPNNHLRLKEGTPVMLLRNLNQAEGLCNGTRLIVTRLGKWSIRGDIISGISIGKNITIPRIIMSPNESRWPFKLNRRQLPVAQCFAMTINKSQGQSLEHVGLYLPKQVFTHGQLYVAVSRVTKREGLVIVNADEEMEDRKFVKNIVYKEIFQNIISGSKSSKEKGQSTEGTTKA